MKVQMGSSILTRCIRWKRRATAIIERDEISRSESKTYYTSNEHRRTPKNTETLEQIYGGRTENIPVLMRERRSTAVLWCVQGDEAARVEAEATVDGVGRAPEVE